MEAATIKGSHAGAGGGGSDENLPPGTSASPQPRSRADWPRAWLPAGAVLRPPRFGKDAAECHPDAGLDPNPDHVGIYYALNHGYFSRTGLNMKIQVPGRATPPSSSAATRITWTSTGLGHVRGHPGPRADHGRRGDNAADSRRRHHHSQVRSHDHQGPGRAQHRLLQPEGKTTAKYVMQHNDQPRQGAVRGRRHTLVQALLSGKVTAMTGGLANVEAIQTRRAFHQQEPVFTPSSEGFPPYPQFTLVANTSRLKESGIREDGAERSSRPLSRAKWRRWPTRRIAGRLKKVTQYTPQFLALSTPEPLKLIKPSPGAGWDCLNVPQLQQRRLHDLRKIITGHVDVAQEATTPTTRRAEAGQAGRKP